jgi:hypothetical protein
MGLVGDSGCRECFSRVWHSIKNKCLRELLWAAVMQEEHAVTAAQRVSEHSSVLDMTMHHNEISIGAETAQR